MAISVYVQLVIQELSVRQVNTGYVNPFSAGLSGPFHALIRKKEARENLRLRDHSARYSF